MNDPAPATAMSLDDAARALGVSRGSIYNFIRRGDLKAKKLGRRTVILRSDLDAFLNELPQASVQS